MGSRPLFDGQPLPSQHGVGMDRVPGSMAHLAEPILDLSYTVPEGSEAYVADRNWFKMMVGADGVPRSVLVIAKGERVDPARVEALKMEQAMFALETEIPHARHDGRRPVSADPNPPEEEPDA